MSILSIKIPTHHGQKGAKEYADAEHDLQKCVLTNLGGASRLAADMLLRNENIPPHPLPHPSTPPYVAAHAASDRITLTF